MVSGLRDTQQGWGPEKQHVLLAGMGDKKIVQWDQRSGLITQQYDQHMGPVNTITFIDNNTKFVTTGVSRVWACGRPSFCQLQINSVRRNV